MTVGQKSICDIACQLNYREANNISVKEGKRECLREDIRENETSGHIRVSEQTHNSVIEREKHKQDTRGIKYFHL